MRGVSHESSRCDPLRAEKVVQKNLARYTDSCGSHVRSGRRQSMPSSSIDNCARVNETLPLAACGHTNRPRSNRFENRQSPSPSNHRTLIRSPRRPRNTNTCPENGLCSNLVCTSALNPVNPRRRSVTPAAIHTRVFVGGPIMPAGTPTTPAPIPDRRCLRSAPAPAAVRCESCPAVLAKSRRPTLTGRGASTLSLTRTDSSVYRRLAPPKSSSRYSLRQPNTWLALMPCARATRATDAPSTNVSSTIRRFSVILRRCRWAAPNDSLLAVITSETCREVSISAPSGRLSGVSTSKNDFPLSACPDGQDRTLTEIVPKAPSDALDPSLNRNRPGRGRVDIGELMEGWEEVST